jgi:hypothetical protein
MHAWVINQLFEGVWLADDTSQRTHAETIELHIAEMHECGNAEYTETWPGKPAKFRKRVLVEMQTCGNAEL